MSILVSTDRANYRRWVSAIPSVILPGAGHVLSNRWRAGLFWFIGYLVFTGLKFYLIFSPNAHATMPQGVRLASDCVFFAFVCGDACRQAMPRFGLKGWLRLFVLAIGVPLFLYLCVRQFLLQPFYVPAAGMEPTLMGTSKSPASSHRRGDSIMVNKFTYRFREPRRGEIVVFRTAGLPDLPQDQVFVKRVAGLPGEKVSIQPPFLRVNGTNVIRPEIFERIASGSAGSSGFTEAGRLASESDAIVLGNDEYLVLGDNTKNSLDGRYFGPIKRENILGKVAWIYSPLERRGWPQ